MINKKRLLMTYIFYLIILLWVILFRLNIEQFCGKYNGISLIPFADKDFYTSTFARYACEIGNAISFIPSGIYLSLFFKKDKSTTRILKSICFIILLSLFLEIIQYILVIGVSSTTDLIHNLIGGLIGVIIYESLKRFVSEPKIDLINKYTLYVIIPISAFAIINTLIHIKYYL